MIEFITGILVGVALTKKVRKLRELTLPSWLTLPPYIRIVKFGEGQYAIRRGYINYHFKDCNENFWWSNKSNDNIKKYCITDLETCKRNLKDGSIHSNGTPID